MSEELRNMSIESVRRTIHRFKGWEKEWIEEERKKGNDPDKDLSVRTVRMLLDVYDMLLNSELQLLVVEGELRKFKQADSAKSILLATSRKR